MQGLDRYITGNWGEDSVAPEFVRAEELGDLEGEVRIDVAPQTSDRQIPVTIESVAITSGFVYLTTKELEYVLQIPQDALVYFADDDEV
ncbi:hypothetical protein [Streptomyces sp. 5-10]|uniref:hypothetical protein n=1 Tax=Streptomyces sp. 5-10 TaxID=878925 RepID=UPI00168B9722|nr:hypothetical protein [Streptomyces sp. 5-10]MBD3004647.1 hypothetical protein [Streptomyces sp. 5-10]